MSRRRGHNTRETGTFGEQIAADFLVKKGYEIVGYNFSKRFGEIDIVAWHHKPHFGRTLCFVEVKYRQHHDGSAERSVNRSKQQRMHYSAHAYCIEVGIDSGSTPIQFEQISIYGQGTERVIFHYDIIA